MTTSAPARLAVLSATAPRARSAGAPVLGAATAELDEHQLALVRRLARRQGRVLERDGLAVLGCGVAAHLELPGGIGAPGAAAEAARLLAELDPSAVALGALPFDPAAPGRLVVPAITALAGDGEGEGRSVAGGRLVVVADRASVEALAARLSAMPAGPELEQAIGALLAPPAAGSRDDGLDGTAQEPPDAFQLRSARSHDDFRRRVAAAVAAIDAGRERLEKVVLAREVEVVANRPLRQHDLVERLRALHPSCATFALDGFVGASPELLCARRGELVRSVPLAGTVARSGDPDEDRRLADALRASPKERAEHGLVVQAIVDDLREHCAEVAATAEPGVLELRNVAHLATTITGRLVDGASSLELVTALHPTPAVGGWPRDAALAYLAEHEGLARDRFAGPVGYLEASGDGEWWIGIRCALVEGSRARLLAGVGIVAGSDPAAELAETQLKLQALLAVAVRP